MIERDDSGMSGYRSGMERQRAVYAGLVGLNWIGLEWIGVDWIGLDWIGLGWEGVGGRVRVRGWSKGADRTSTTCAEQRTQGTSLL